MGNQEIEIVKAIFWTALMYVVYVYLGYPLLLTIWQRLAPRPVRKRHQEPTVSLVIAMRNERSNVQQKLQNCFELDYPRDKLQVIVSLDAPTDGTDELVRAYAGQGVDIAYSDAHGGKAAAVNRGVEIANGEIVLFADARQRFEKNAVRELVANFTDESIGAVSGELVLLDEYGREASDSLGAYWRYEKKLRAMESDIHSVPGATGAIYAIRRELFVPLAPETILDDVVTPMRIVLRGKRSIWDPAARAYDDARPGAAKEYERKARTLSGNYQLFARMPELLAPWRNPIFVQFTSHKVGRLLVPYYLAVLFVSNLCLPDGLYHIFLVCQVLWYSIACAGGLFSIDDNARVTKLLRIPYAFVLMNWAAVAGLYYFANGSRDIWNPVTAGNTSNTHIK
jgi:cellulose synthase/poly-beta-1,6-N-acetylglucosamine synthase-like glycosyltransferase